MDPIPDEDWPPSIGRNESNLVMIEHGRDTLPGAEEAEEMQRHYVGGKVDSIAERKKASHTYMYVVVISAYHALHVLYI